jgi:hypothetical protein
MTRWLLRCTACGRERALEVGFNLLVFGGKIYLYCKSCKANREHLILGCVEPADICADLASGVSKSA